MRKPIVTSRLNLAEMNAGVFSAIANGKPAHAASLMQVQIGDECDLSRAERPAIARHQTI
jgi:hypothetical protein